MHIVAEVNDFMERFGFYALKQNVPQKSYSYKMVFMKLFLGFLHEP